MKALKAFIKPFEAPQWSAKIQIYVIFFSLSGMRTERVKWNAPIILNSNYPNKNGGNSGGSEKSLSKNDNLPGSSFNTKSPTHGASPYFWKKEVIPKNLNWLFNISPILKRKVQSYVEPR